MPERPPHPYSPAPDEELFVPRSRRDARAAQQAQEAPRRDHGESAVGGPSRPHGTGRPSRSTARPTESRSSGPQSSERREPIDSAPHTHSLGNVSRPATRRARREAEKGRRARKDRRPSLVTVVSGAALVLAVLAGVVVAIDRIPTGPDTTGTAALTAATASTSASLAMGETTPTLAPSARATATATKTRKATVKKSETRAAAAPAPKKTTAKPVAGAADSVKLGVFRGTYPGEVEAFGDWLGRDVDYATDFSSRTSWDEIANPAYMLEAWKGSGYRMVYATAMLPTQDDSATMAAGAAGEYDQYFKTLAQNLVNADQGDSIIRLGWEFNLSASRWHPDTKANFIGYWRHIVEAMRSVPGTEKLEFDWNPNIGGEVYDSTKYYPGNQYVDYVGIDTYDISWVEGSYPYPKSCNAACKQSSRETAWNNTLNGTFGLNFWADFARSKGKPLTLPEWGLWERPDGHGGGDNKYYIQQMFDFINDPSNNVGYHSYFEVNVGSSGSHMLETHTSAGSLFKKLLG
ncbi:glycoside hydrolase family 26 protein [Kineosporia succinea]|uniref:GH26 domain-containing protein n=1 Tax=Kineosporia succinea TaxID=84632 RepID=A0ABT9P5H6_9ACTN|nr:glycosyl hydrolase [Kineosporia succinea]MDP9827732.1 hypothetical protein [Kineosporia succinea]